MGKGRHAHAADQSAYTMTPEKIGIYHSSNLQQKWDLVDEVKRTSSVDDYTHVLPIY